VRRDNLTENEFIDKAEMLLNLQYQRQAMVIPRRNK
jgi:hypothetical protein